MKKISVLVILCAFFFAAQAQSHECDGKHQPERCNQKECQTMMKLKREFMMQNLQLQPEQTDKFWAAYDRMENTEYEILKEQRNQKQAAGIPAKLAPDSIQILLNDDQILLLYRLRVESKQKLAQIESDFLNEAAKILTPQQIDQYYQLERKFKHTAVKHTQKKDLAPNMKLEAKPMPTKNR